MSNLKLVNEAGPKISLVIPIYNEEAVLPILVKRIKELIAKIDGETEVILVDDGSRDASVPYMRYVAEMDRAFRVIELSRNFGHQVAITAGMDAARGAAVVVMDADLQDPPEVVLQLIEKWKQGYEIVYARRIKREGETAFKRVTANLFYRLLAAMTSVNIPRDVGDFRLVGRKALDTFKMMPERDRFVRGMFAWMGFRQTEVLFERQARAAGETKYPFWKMVRLATHGIVSFSEKPLRFALWAGLAISGLAGVMGIIAVIGKLAGLASLDGWTSIVVIMLFIGGVNLFMTGIVGLYVGGIHSEVKRRPLYVIGRDSAAESVLTQRPRRSTDRPAAVQEKRLS